MRPPVELSLAEVAPRPSLFTHRSTLHGQSHVARVMIHAFRLVEATGWLEEAPRLWAAVYLHDLPRTHDGVCYRHTGDAIKKFESLPELPNSRGQASATAITHLSRRRSCITVCQKSSRARTLTGG